MLKPKDVDPLAAIVPFQPLSLTVTDVPVCVNVPHQRLEIF